MAHNQIARALLEKTNHGPSVHVLGQIARLEAEIQQRLKDGEPPAKVRHYRDEKLDEISLRQWRHNEARLVELEKLREENRRAYVAEHERDPAAALVRRQRHEVRYSMMSDGEIEGEIVTYAGAPDGAWNRDREDIEALVTEARNRPALNTPRDDGKSSFARLTQAALRHDYAAPWRHTERGREIELERSIAEAAYGKLTIPNGDDGETFEIDLESALNAPIPGDQ